MGYVSQSLTYFGAKWVNRPNNKNQKKPCEDAG